MAFRVWLWPWFSKASCGFFNDLSVLYGVDVSDSGQGQRTAAGRSSISRAVRRLADFARHPPVS